ncbi:MAG: DHA2 family efflux MFS transporter permease subunit [Reyranella sp.]
MSEASAREQVWDVLPRSAAGNRNPWLVAVVLSIATFMEVLDASIANVSLRNIAGSMAASLDESTWVLTSYLVASAVVLPISGWLAGVIGRKRFNMLSITIFTASSVLCAMAPNLQALIALRVIQGLGGGGLAPVEQSMLADTFPVRQRGQAFALYGLAVIVAPTVGPTLGGWLTDHLSWHWIFLINGPIGVIALVLVHTLVHEPEILERERRARLARGLKVDWIGFLLVAACLGSLEIVLDKGVEDDWFASRFIVTFAAVAFVSLLLLVPWELSRDDPIVDLRLFGHRQFATCVALMFAAGAILFSSTQILPQLVQTNFQYTPTWSGLALMPGGLAMALMMPVVGFLSNRVPLKYLIGCGLTLVALSMWHLTSLGPDANFGFFAWARTYQTVGLPFMFIPILSSSYAGLAQSQTDQASALINVARNVGGSTGISIANTVLVNGEQIHRNYLVDQLIPTSLPFQQALQDAIAQFSAMAVPPDAQLRAYALIDQIVQQQAMLLSYIDVFALWAIAAAVLIPAPFVLLRSQPAARGLER